MKARGHCVAMFSTESKAGRRHGFPFKRYAATMFAFLCILCALRYVATTNATGGDKRRLKSSQVPVDTKVVRENYSSAERAASLRSANVDVDPYMCRNFINLFTTFIDESTDLRKVAAQENTLDALHRLQRHGVQAWLFTTSDSWAQKAAARNIITVREFDTNSQGTPVLRSMFQHVLAKTRQKQHACETEPDGGFIFDGYFNGDIIFTSALVETLRVVRGHWRNARDIGGRPNVLLVGRRTNVDFHAHETIDSDAACLEKAKKGVLFLSHAQDYFIYSRGTRDWGKMPGFVVGRRAYDNWIVDNTFHGTDTGTLSLIPCSGAAMRVLCEF